MRSNTKLVCFYIILILPAVIIANTCDVNDTKGIEDHIIAMEKEALKSWNNGDPSGYLKIYAEEITYFDEGTTVRLDGHSVLEERFAPIKGKIYNARFEMINPKVQLYGDVGILTYNLITYSDKREVTSRWNSTAVYSKIDGVWKIIHSHWSYTKQKKENQNLLQE